MLHGATRGIDIFFTVVFHFSRFYWIRIWSFYGNFIIGSSICMEAVSTLLEYCDNVYSDDLTQGCSNSIANALALLQSCTKPWTSGIPNPVIQVHVIWTGIDMWTLTQMSVDTHVSAFGLINTSCNGLRLFRAKPLHKPMLSYCRYIYMACRDSWSQVEWF